jgi:hypothetical protein
MPETFGAQEVEKQKRMGSAELGELVKKTLRELWDDQATVAQLKEVTGKLMSNEARDVYLQVLNACEKMEGHPHVVDHVDPRTGKATRYIIKNPQPIRTRAFKESYEADLYAGLDAFFHENGEILSSIWYKLSVKPRDKSEYEDRRPTKLRSLGLG